MNRARRWMVLKLHIQRLTGQNLDVDGVGLAARRAAGVIARIRLVGILNLQFAVRSTAVVRFNFDSVTLRLKIQQHIVVEPEDVIWRDRALRV